MENELEAQASQTRAKAEPKPALVITIHNRATPIFGLVMLLVGLAGGYFGRPLISRGNPAAAQVTAATASTNPESQTAATASPEEQASREEMMAFIVSQTRHFVGNPEAAITIVEFGDFQ